MVRSFVRSFVCSFVRSFVRSFVPSIVRSFVHSFVRSFVRSFIRSFIRPFIDSVSHSFVHSFVPSFICSFIPSFVIALLHSFVHSFTLCIWPLLDVDSGNLCTAECAAAVTHLPQAHISSQQDMASRKVNERRIGLSGGCGWGGGGRPADQAVSVAQHGQLGNLVPCCDLQLP